MCMWTMDCHQLYFIALLNNYIALCLVKSTQIATLQKYFFNDQPFTRETCESVAQSCGQASPEMPAYVGAMQLLNL